MPWASIIELILQLVGPLLTKMLENCTKKTLKTAAAGLDAPMAFASEGEAAAAMIDAAIEKLPKRAFVRRRALEKLKAKAVVNGKVRTTPLTSAELKEGKKLVKGIRPV